MGLTLEKKTYPTTEFNSGNGNQKLMFGILFKKTTHLMMEILVS